MKQRCFTLLEFSISRCSSNHHCHLFQKIFGAKKQIFPVLWRIWMWIMDDCFHVFFCKLNYFNPSSCRTSFLSSPSFLFSSPVLFSRFTVHYHVYIRMHSLPVDNLSWKHSKNVSFDKRIPFLILDSLENLLPHWWTLSKMLYKNGKSTSCLKFIHIATLLRFFLLAEHHKRASKIMIMIIMMTIICSPFTLVRQEYAGGFL